jgi:citrate synthase
MGNTQPTPPNGELRATGTLDIKDSRTDKTYSVKILQGGVEGDTASPAMDLRQIKTSPDEFGLMTYDPAFMNTASCKSAITFIDGDKGILRYRGYPIEQLAEKSTFLEVAWLLRHGELPTQAEYDGWVHDITYHTYVHENIKTFLQGFRYDAHPMSMLCSAVAAMSSFYPEAKNIHEPESRNISIVRLLAKAADARRVLLSPHQGSAVHLPRQRPELRREFPVDGRANVGAEVRGESGLREGARGVVHPPRRSRAELFDERRARVGSSQVDPFSAIAAGVAALYGPLHGGANEQVLRMINEIGHPKNVSAFIDEVKGGKGSRLMGFGHRVYKSYDPRAKIVKKLADEVFAQIGMDKDLEIALELERIALSDEYFVVAQAIPETSILYGPDYRSMAFPTDFFTVLFAWRARPAGWRSGEEMLNDKEQKIARPRQIYVGYGERPFTSRPRRAVFPSAKKNALKKGRASEVARRIEW